MKVDLVVLKVLSLLVEESRQELNSAVIVVSTEKEHRTNSCR